MIKAERKSVEFLFSVPTEQTAIMWLKTHV